jgi:hypothetical protein
VTGSATFDGPRVANRCRMRIRSLFLMFVLTGCGGASGTRPHDMTAAEHMTEAAEHGTMAAQSGGPYAGTPHPWDRPGAYSGHGWYPWYYYWDPSIEHRRLAAAHVAAAEAVKLEYQAACTGIQETTQATSPLDIYALGSERLRDAVILHLAPEAGPPEVLLVRMRCHRAWLRLAPRDDEPNDLIAVDGAKIVVHAGGRDTIEVMFSIGDPVALSELDRRAQIAVLRAKQRRDAEKRPPVTGQRVP